MGCRATYGILSNSVLAFISARFGLIARELAENEIGLESDDFIILFGLSFLEKNS